MSERGIALFLHLLGVVLLFLAMGVVQLGGARIRGASRVEDIRLWLGLVRTTSRLYPISTLLLIVSGLYLTARFWSFALPWVVVPILSVVVMGVLGGRVVGGGLEAIGRAATGVGPVSDELARLTREPRLWMSATAVNGAGLGVLWVMVNKPGWFESLAVLGALLALGAILGARMAGRAPLEATSRLKETA